MPRGGRRHGAGRKPKITKPLEPAKVLAHPSSAGVPVVSSVPLPPIERFDPPAGLSDEERQVWIRQAPHAFENRTLTPATALAFERYCRVVVLERREALSSAVSGANHRGLLKQINTYELQFGLAANGRPLMAAPPAVTDEDEAFFGRPRAGQQSA